MSEHCSTRRLLFITAFTIGVLTACSGEDPPSALGFVDDAPIVLAPEDGATSEENQRLISFHADWLCELQRRTFTDLEDADEALTVALVDANITTSDYEMFTKEALPTQAVRDAVRYAYQEECSVK